MFCFAIIEVEMGIN